MTRSTHKNGYGLYVLREFKKGDVLGLCIGNFVDTKQGNMVESNCKWQLNNLATDGNTSYIGLHFINDLLYNFHVKKKETLDMTDKEPNFMINKRKAKNGYRCNVLF